MYYVHNMYVGKSVYIKYYVHTPAIYVHTYVYIQNGVQRVEWFQIYTSVFAHYLRVFISTYYYTTLHVG